MAHVPVLLTEVLEGLALRDDGVYVDATFGRGGHSAAILERLSAAGRLVALDRDDTAVTEARAKFEGDPRFAIAHRSFAAIREVCEAHDILGRVDGLLFDFGVSSPQLDEGERGFSFLNDGPLDMRMDRRQTLTAADYLAEVDEQTLARDLKQLGEEPLARAYARAIVAARADAPITRTVQLADLIESVTPARVRRRSNRHPATRVFQAIRMRINDELGELEAALDAVPDVLAVGGRVAFLTFHSLEDRPVKRFLRAMAAEDPAWRGLPDMPEHARARMRIVGRDRKAGPEEIEDNPRSRSARLRVGERLR
ncbi:MAG: 16S rRNA (cytosine(1402)-N(4))-methyltransferase RsmH [Pseudomonadota bacterium]